ncbi:transposable element Tc3 transposase [Trichonephila clavipes]|nr:transposable element Tc3 transposase [Trichonephila clavipes]
MERYFHMERYYNEGDAFLLRIIAIDKKWVRVYEPGLKRQSNGWHHRVSPRAQKLRLKSSRVQFQQDGATCHTARATIDLLKDTFGDCLISRFGPVNWPPRSCDLTPLDYFLWGYVKSLVYEDKPQTLDHLEDNIRRVIADIRPQMLEKVIENRTSRLDYIRASRGSPMPEIIFKM